MTNPKDAARSDGETLGAARLKSREKLFKSPVWYYLCLAVTAIGFGCLHRHHVSTLFENHIHFSHLSTLEREMAFPTEMGLYYFYFKSLVEAPSFVEGLVEITHNNITEYPKVINSLERFNLLPEVVVAGLYRIFSEITAQMDINTVKCWQVSRGEGSSGPIVSCEGIGEPVYFYLEAVWFCAGVTAAVLFLFSVFLSDSYVGGLLAVACFFFNHGECTRVQWTPPLRESFAYPFLLLQMFLICSILKKSGSRDAQMNKKVLFRLVKHVSVVSCLCHLLWQFSSFVLATQMGCIILMYCMGNINRSTFISVLASHTSAVVTALLLLWGNELLFGSMLSVILVISWLGLVLESRLPVDSDVIRRLNAFFIALPTAFLLFHIRQDLIGSQQDAHIFHILLSKVTDYKNFHTLLYTCSAEFDFLPMSAVTSITETGLLPAAITALIFVFISWAKMLTENTSAKSPKNATKTEKKQADLQGDQLFLPWKILFYSSEKLEPHILYHVFQLIVFMFLALFIMRLKLFFTPHLSLTVSLLASQKMVPFVRKRETRWALIVLLFGFMSIKGVSNIRHQENILGEYSNSPMEEMLLWIRSSTDSKAVFAGPMAVMASVLLSTKRPVVNHPHYEDFELRERTKAVYSIYSNKTPLEVYGILASLSVDYVVVDSSHCHRTSRRGCTMADLWKVEDPKNANKPNLCRVLFSKDPSPLKRVFMNQRFAVLQLPSKTVEYKPVSTAPD